MEAKEQQIGRLQQENKQARRNYMTATKNTETHLGGQAANISGSILNKLNKGIPGLSGVGNAGGPGNVMASLQGLSKGGYQPKMFGAKANDTTTDSGTTSERSFTSRFGAATNQVSSSIDVLSQGASHKFLG